MSTALLLSLVDDVLLIAAARGGGGMIRNGPREEVQLRELRRRIEEAAASMTRPVPRQVITEHTLAAGAQPREIAPARKDRLRCEVRVVAGGPVLIAHDAKGGGLRLTLDGPPYVDDWPTAHRGDWYASAAVLSTVAVLETIPEEPLP